MWVSLDWGNRVAMLPWKEIYTLKGWKRVLQTLQGVAIRDRWEGSSRSNRSLRRLVRIQRGSATKAAPTTNEPITIPTTAPTGMPLCGGSGGGGVGVGVGVGVGSEGGVSSNSHLSNPTRDYHQRIPSAMDLPSCYILCLMATSTG